MVEVYIKEHYIYKEMLLAVAQGKEIVVRHRDYPHYRLHLSDSRRMDADTNVTQQPSVARLTLSDIEQVLGYPIAIVSSNDAATHVLKGGGKCHV